MTFNIMIVTFHEYWTSCEDQPNREKDGTAIGSQDVQNDYGGDRYAEGISQQDYWNLENEES